VTNQRGSNAYLLHLVNKKLWILTIIKWELESSIWRQTHQNWHLYVCSMNDIFSKGQYLTTSSEYQFHRNLLFTILARERFIQKATLVFCVSLCAVPACTYPHVPVRCALCGVCCSLSRCVVAFGPSICTFLYLPFRRWRPGRRSWAGKGHDSTPALLFLHKF
jgi:hypothetical protein